MFHVLSEEFHVLSRTKSEIIIIANAEALGRNTDPVKNLMREHGFVTDYRAISTPINSWEQVPVELQNNTKENTH